jgi:hypothetical protein
VAARPSPFDQIEAELLECLASWQSLADFDRCNSWRLRLLEQAVATEVPSPADAAAALRFALRAGCEDGPDSWDDPETGFNGIGRPEEARLVNIIQNAQRYLAGRASA